MSMSDVVRVGRGRRSNMQIAVNNLNDAIERLGDIRASGPVLRQMSGVYEELLRVQELIGASPSR